MQPLGALVPAVVHGTAVRLLRANDLFGDIGPPERSQGKRAAAVLMMSFDVCGQSPDAVDPCGR